MSIALHIAECIGETVSQRIKGAYSSYAKIDLFYQLGVIGSVNYISWFTVVL